MGSFIKGIADTFIRQRLLESKKLKLEEAINNTTILKRPHENARRFESSQEAPRFIAVAEVESDKQEHEFTERCALTLKESKTANGSIVKGCRNCRYTHEYGKCSAYNQECYNCGKLKHFSKCCSKRKIFTPSGRDSRKGTASSLLANINSSLKCNANEQYAKTAITKMGRAKMGGSTIQVNWSNRNSKQYDVKNLSIESPRKRANMYEHNPGMGKA